MNAGKKESAVTLIEVLIAASLFAIISASLYSVFRSGLSSYSRIESSLKVYQAARQVFYRIESDLRNAYFYTDDDSRFSGASRQMSFFSVGRTAACSLAYKWDNGALKRISLYGINAFTQDSVPEEYRFSSLIKNISFQYAPPADKGPVWEWLDSWPGSEGEHYRGSLPFAVKISLSLPDKEFTKIIFLPLMQNRQ